MKIPYRHKTPNRRFTGVKEVKRGGQLMNIMKKLFLVMITVLFGFVNQTQAMEFDDLGGIDVHGFISQGYLQSDENNFFADTKDGTTQFNEMGINFSADVTEKLRLGVQLFARDMGNIGNNDVILDWAIADYRWRDWLGIRAGNMKWVIGLYNESRDIDMLRTPIFLPQGVYNEAWRETSGLIQGAGLYGELPTGKLGAFSYDLQYGSSSMPVDGGAAKLLNEQYPYALKKNFAITDVRLRNIDNEFSSSVALKWDTPLDGLVLGGNYWGYKFSAKADAYMDAAILKSNADTNLTNTINPGLAQIAQLEAAGVTLSPTLQATKAVLEQKQAFWTGVSAFNTVPGLLGDQIRTYDHLIDVKHAALVGSVEYTWRNLVVAAEYMQQTYNVEIDNELFTLAGLDRVYTVPEFDAIGYYGSISYRFTYWFELGAYYSEYYRDKDDKDGKKRSDPVTGTNPHEPDHRSWLKDACLTTRFDINENWVLKLEGHVMNGTAVIFAEDNLRPTDFVGPTGSHWEEDWFLGAAKITFSF
jgi:hypothetical protein